MKRKYSVEVDGQGDPFTLSISDLMAGILVVFILALVSIFITYKEGADGITNAEAKRSAILNTIHKTFKDDLVKTSYVDESRGVIVITAEGGLGANGIFPSGSSKLTDGSIGAVNGEAIVKELADKIVAARKNPELTEAWKAIDTIMIEGHSDTNAFEEVDLETNTIVEGNLPLSTRRAIRTWNKMVESHPELDPGRFPNSSSQMGAKSLYVNSRGEPLFSVAGYGATRPLKSMNIVKLNPDGSIQKDKDGNLQYSNIQINGDNSKQRRIEIRFIIQPSLGE